MQVIDKSTVVLYDALSDEQKKLADICDIDVLEKGECSHHLVDSVVQQIPNLNFAYRDNQYHLVWTPLTGAIENNNLYLVKKLLDCGADPDAHIAGDAPALWDLQYLWNDYTDAEKVSQESEIRYEMALALLDHGADPFSIPDGSESLYEYIRFKIFNEFGNINYDYLVRFYIALTVYGVEKHMDAYPSNMYFRIASCNSGG